MPHALFHSTWEAGPLVVALQSLGVAAFNAGLLTQAVDQLRSTGLEIDDVSHLGPTMTEHINVHGRYHSHLDQAPKWLRNMPAHPPAGDH